MVDFFTKKMFDFWQKWSIFWQKLSFYLEVEYPFDEVIKCNIGDAHAMGQGPITYIRQVVSGAAYPDLLAAGNNNGVIPSDASAQAKRILDGCGGGSLGAYSNSAGIQVIRDDIAR